MSGPEQLSIERVDVFEDDSLADYEALETLTILDGPALLLSLLDNSHTTPPNLSRLVIRRAGTAILDTDFVNTGPNFSNGIGTVPAPAALAKNLPRLKNLDIVVTAPTESAVSYLFAPKARHERLAKAGEEYKKFGIEMALEIDILSQGYIPPYLYGEKPAWREVAYVHGKMGVPLRMMQQPLEPDANPEDLSDEADGDCDFPYGGLFE